MSSLTIEPTHLGFGTMSTASMSTGTASPVELVRPCLGALHESFDVARIDVRLRGSDSACDGVSGQDLAWLAGEVWGRAVAPSEVLWLRGGEAGHDAVATSTGEVWLEIGTAIRDRCQRIEPVRCGAGHPMAASRAAVAALATATDGRRWLVEAGAGRQATVRPIAD